MIEYAYNYDILCAACNKPRYFGYTDLPDSKMCCCHSQDKIPTYDRRLGELTDEALLYASEEDWAFYREAVAGLPTREGFKGNYLDKDDVEIPHGSGPHILRHFREALQITNPGRVLEIGFNFGHGSAMLLKLGVNVLSVDISHKWETLFAALLLEKRSRGCFSYYNREHLSSIKTHIGMAFIDGAHDQMSVFGDICTCKDMEIPYLLFDDWYSRYGETQKAVALFPELELVKDMNNLRLYKVNY